MRMLFVGMAAAICLLFVTSPAKAYAVHITDPGTIKLQRANELPLALTDGAVSPAPVIPFFPRRELDSLKTRAAIDGMVTLAAVGFDAKKGGETSQQSRQRQAELAILDLNVRLYLSLMIVGSAALMWMCVGLQRETA